MLASTMWLPLDISGHGSAIDSLITFLHYFMALLFVGWGVYFAYCLVRFRAGSNRQAGYADIKAKPSKAAEIVVVLVEAVLLIGFAMPVWAYYRNEPPTAADDPMTVRVVGQQFAWNIHYPGPDGKFGATRPELVDETTNPVGLMSGEDDPAAADDYVSINQFHIPKDRKIIARLSSKDVIHCFAVPLLRVKQDVIPGMEIPVWFEAKRTNADVREAMKRTVSLPESADGAERFAMRHKNFMTTTAVTAGGKTVARAETLLNEESVTQLIAAGVSEIEITPRDPVNIQCAQLCGLGHYRMLGQMQIHPTEESFDAWYTEMTSAEEEFLDEDEFEDEDE